MFCDQYNCYAQPFSGSKSCLHRMPSALRFQLATSYHLHVLITDPDVQICSNRPRRPLLVRVRTVRVKLLLIRPRLISVRLLRLSPNISHKQNTRNRAMLTSAWLTEEKDQCRVSGCSESRSQFGGSLGYCFWHSGPCAGGGRCGYEDEASVVSQASTLV
jgi:hypothetical protein